MYTYIDGNHLARTLAEERTARKRESIVLAQPGIVLRSLASRVRGVVRVLADGLTPPSGAFAYCTTTPQACQSPF
jgi:hypothetical protein